MIRVKCPACGRVYDLGDDLAGKKIECECGCKFYLTGPASAPQPAPLSVPPPPAAAPQSSPSGTSDKSDPAAPAVQHSDLGDPGTCWAAAVLQLLSVLIVCVGVAVGLYVMGAAASFGQLYQIGGLAIIVVSIVSASPIACYATITDRVHRLEWYARRIEWYTRRDFEERHPGPPEAKK